MPKYPKVYRLSRRGNLLLTSGTFGSKKQGFFGRGRLLIDTGSSYTILPVKILEELGYHLRNPVRRENLITGQGEIYVPVISVSWFNSLGQSAKNFEIAAYNLPKVTRVDGILGMNFLLNFQAVISVADAEISFQQK
jgi:aspartyl protease family protein